VTSRGSPKSHSICSKNIDQLTRTFLTVAGLTTMSLAGFIFIIHRTSPEAKQVTFFPGWLIASGRAFTLKGGLQVQ